MVIDGVEYVPVSKPADIKIVVCDRGFVLVGRVEIKDRYVVITDCGCVRIWGTTKGLGEIASNGPTDSTKIDKQPRTVVHELQVVQMIDCEASKWSL